MEESVHQILRTNDFNLILERLELMTIWSIQSGQVLDLMQLIRTVDDNLISASPILCLAYAWDLLANYDFESCEIWLEKATVLSGLPEGQKKIADFSEIFEGIVK